MDWKKTFNRGQWVIHGIFIIAVIFGVMWSQSVQAQQLNSAQREVWQTVETRWRAWQAGDLEKMLILYHSRFHAWNRVTGRLDGHDAMLARWKTALQSEKILAVNLQPIAVEVYGEFAAVFYVSRETVKVTSGASNEEGGLPNVVAIRWRPLGQRKRPLAFRGLQRRTLLTV